MNRIAFLGVLLVLLVGCATTQGTAPSAEAAGTPFRGEVWTWDERTNVVTLRQGAQNIRVHVTPDQIRTLRLHEVMTVRGEIAPPENVQQVSAGPMRAVPRGTAQQSEVDGTVSAADPKGLVSIDTTTGRLTVWTATPDTSNFPSGTAVRVKTSVQPMQFVPATDAGAAKTSDPSAPVMTEPGDHSVVTGRIISADSRGTITVESPRGPITVAMPNAASQRVGDTVQVRTSLQRAQ